MWPSLAVVGYVEATWLLLVKSVVIFIVIFSIAGLLTITERKVLGRFQSRYGPNRVGPYGLLQPLADGVKLMSKEHFSPVTSHHKLMMIAPIITVFAAVTVMAIVPFGDRGTWGDAFGLYGIDVDIGILYFFAIGSLGTYGLVVGGWASGSKYSFLGAMRSVAQLVSYEASLGLSLLGVAIMAGSLSLTEIVNAQQTIWYVVPQFFGFLVFVVAMFAESNRVPFDLAEAETELVAGYQTEFGGMGYGSFMLAEYVNLVVLSAIAVTMFFGGWKGPGPTEVGPIWFLVKMSVFFLFFFWIRATLPRFRYDQLMSFGWKILLPLATANVLVTAIVVAVS